MPAPTGTSLDPWLVKANEAFDASTTFVDTNYRKDWENSISHFQNKHMQGSKYLSDAYKFRSKMFRPKTRTAVRQNESATAAAFFSQLDVMSVEPEDDRNPLSIAGAALRQELINYRLSRKGQIPWFQICVGGMQEANIYGIVCSKQFWDYETVKKDSGSLDEQGNPVMDTVTLRDQPEIKLYPIENIRFDAASEWTNIVESSPYFIAMDAMRVGTVRHKIAIGEWEPVDDALLLTARNCAYDSTRQAREGDKEDSKENKFSKALSDFDVVWVHENFLRIDNEDIHCYTLGKVALLSKPKLLKKAYLHGRRPFQVGTCMIEPHKAIPDSPVHLAKGLQKQTDTVANTRMDNVLLVLNKRHLVKRGANVDIQSLVRNSPGSATMVNSLETDVKSIEYNDVTQSSYAEQDRINNDIDEMLGAFSQGSIQTNRKLNETVGGMAMIRGASNSMTQYLIRVFSETWVEPVLNQLDLLEQHYESDIELLNLMGRRADIQKHGIEAITKDLLMAPCQVVVNVANSAMDPMIRLQAFTQAMQSYTMMRKEMPPDLDPEPIKAYIFGLLGFRDASRFSVETDNPQVSALMQENQQLKQALDSKQQDIEAKNAAVLAKIQADSTAKAAQIESDERIEAQRLQQQEMETQRAGRMEIILQKMADDTKVLIAQISADSRAQIAQLSSESSERAVQSSNETKTLATILQSNSQQALEKMKQNGTTVMDSSLKGELGDMAKAFQSIAEGNQSTMEQIAEVVKQLQKNSEKIQKMAESHMAPRETTILERDDEGMPVRSRSQIVQ